MQWHMPSIKTMVTASLAGKDLGELGILTAEQYIRIYCEGRGMTVLKISISSG